MNQAEYFFFVYMAAAFFFGMIVGARFHKIIYTPLWDLLHGRITGGREPK